MLSQSEVFKILKAVREGKARRVEDVYALVAVENRDLDVMFSFFISYYHRKATSQPVTGITLDVYHFLVYLVQFSNYIGNKLAEEHFFALKEIGKQNEHDGRLICELEKVEVKSKVEKEEVACECQEEKKGLTSKEEKNLRKALEKRSERITLLEKELGRVREEKKALQTEVKDLGKKVRELELKMSKQEMDFQQRQDKMQDLQILEEKLSGLQEEIKRIEAEKAHLLSDKATLEAVLQKLKKRKQKEVAKSEQIEALQREIKSLKVQKVEGDYTQEIEDLRIELLKLKGKERARREDEQNRLEEQERIKQVILSDALQKTTLETVAAHLRLDTLETRRYLNVLNRDYMILPMRSLSNNPTVQFYWPQIVPQTFDIASEDEFLDLLVVADLHLKNVNESFLKGTDQLYTYATSHHISYIIDLGDFTSGFWEKCAHPPKTYEDIQSTEKQLEEILKKFPKDPNVSYCLLGGNHDECLWLGGIDFVKRLEEQRYDFRSLGYRHAYLSFNHKDYFLLNHPSSRLLASESEGLQTRKKLMDHLNELNSSESYLNLFGHFHMLYMDLPGRICSVPSYFKDRHHNGAIHMRIYFDQDKKIDYVILWPLLHHEYLAKQGEYVYQLSKKKK